MNSMWIDTDFDKAADWHFKEHQKLILEAAQMLATALHEHGLGDLAWYDPSYVNHPLNIWVRQSSANWFQMRNYVSALHDSFYDGYTYDELRRSYERGADLDVMDERGEIHKSFKKIVKGGDCDEAVRIVFPDLGLTARPRCFGHGFEDPDPTSTLTEAYREYYKFNAVERNDKFTWRNKPDWAEV